MRRRRRRNAAASIAVAIQAGGARVFVPLIRHPQPPSFVTLASPFVAGTWLVRVAQPLSATPSQSSSLPLHFSVGGTQEPHEHHALHMRLPVDPHEVVHDSVAPAWQVKSSSVRPSQSSSSPLHVSAGGTQESQKQDALHMRLPVEPHDVVHDSTAPTRQV